MILSLISIIYLSILSRFKVGIMYCFEVVLNYPSLKGGDSWSLVFDENARHYRMVLHPQIHIINLR
ncbi:MAG: hypothetical protein ACTSO9_07605, partial [Candidatus Helarchaeota archaeon]